MAETQEACAPPREKVGGDGSVGGSRLYGRGLYFAEHCTKADECELAPGTRGSEASKLCGSAVLQASRVRDAVDAGYQGPFGR